MNTDSKAIETTSPSGASDGDPEHAILPSGESGSRTTAEVLKELRRAFPDMPLAERVAALAALSRN